MLRIVSIAAVLAFLAGCASVPPAQPPLPVAKPAAAFSIARAQALDRTNHTMRHLDSARNQVYVQNFGDAGPVVTLLLGGLGAAANISMIESKTKEDVERLRDRIAVDPLAAFDAAARRAGTALQSAASADAPKASPYLFVTKTSSDPEMLVLAAALLVESHDPASTWTRKYMVQLPGTFTVASLAEVDAAGVSAIRRDLEAGYVALLGQMARETEASIAKEAPIKFMSTFVMPRFGHELDGNLVAEDNDSVWVRARFGLFALRRTHVSHSPREP